MEDGDEEEMDALLLAEDEDSDAEIIRKGPEKPVKESFPHLVHDCIARKGEDVDDSDIENFGRFEHSVGNNV